MKKVISLLIVTVFVFSLLPSFALATDEVFESYTYNFKKGLHNASAGGAAGYITACDEWICEDSSEGEWTCNAYYHFGNGTNAGTHGANYFSFRPKINNADRVPTYSPGIELNAKTQFMSSIAIKIEVKQDGIYAPSLTLATEDSSPIWEVFLTEADVDVTRDTLSAYIPTLDSADRLGRIDAYGDGDNVTKNFLNRELKTGSYYLILISNGMNEKCTFTDEGDNVFRVELLLKSFSLRNTKGAAALEDVDYNLTASALANPDSASDYCDVNVTNLDWHCTNLLKLGYDALASDENKFAFVGDIYTRAGAISESGVVANLWSGRYVFNSGYFTDKDGDGKKETVASGSAFGTSTNFAMKIKAPKPGKYKFYLENNASDKYGCLANVYFAGDDVIESYSSANIDAVIEDKTGIYKLDNGFDSASSHPDGVYLGDVTVSDNCVDYYIIFSPDYDTFKINKATYTVAGRSGFQTLHLSGVKLIPIVEEDLEITKEQQIFDEIKEEKESAIAVLSDSGLSDVATINVLTTEVSSDEAFAQTAKKVMGVRGQKITLTAEDKDGYEFLYWAKGIGANRSVVSDNKVYELKATSGGIWLTAVYRDINSDKIPVIFYNGNGEELSKTLIEVGSEVTMPELPSLIGHGTSIGWATGSSEILYGAGGKIPASGKKMMFVAQYNDPDADAVSIKVNGALYGKYAYGEEVKVTATERENGSGENVFVYWKKDGEIVSFEKTYSFLANEDCELAACYDKYTPKTEALKKIVITADGQNIVSEFIGLDAAIEKGILFSDKATDITFANATHKIALTKDGNHLSAIADISSYVGYALFANGTVIYDK